MRGRGLRRNGAWIFSWMQWPGKSCAAVFPVAEFPALAAALQTFQNGFLGCGNFFRRVAKCAGDWHGLCSSSLRDGFERKSTAVIVAHVVWIFQDVAG